MKKVLVLAAVTAAMVSGFAEEPVQKAATPKKVAVFVQNRTRVAGMDDEADGIRDRLGAAIAGTGELTVVDSSFSADTFRRWKITTAEEKANFIAGIFSGGSAPNVAKMLGCDYIVAATVVGASSMNRNMNGRTSTVYTLRMTLKVMDTTGASVFAMPPWSRQYPVLDASGDPMGYYNILIDQWAEEAGTAVANSAAGWRKPAAIASAVAFTVTTTIDKVVEALESQTKGVKGEQLQELRKVVGGATVELDGAVIGSAPGAFKAEPGLHQIKVTREWMKPYTATVSIAEGTKLDIAMEMSEAGIAKWGTVEALRAGVAKGYADAAMTRGIKVNLDSTNWRNVGSTPERSVVIEGK